MKDEQLRQANLKVTAARLKILHLLEQAGDGHLTAEDLHRLLHQQGEDIGLATVYRALTRFVDAGLVDRHTFDDDKSVYELASEEHHDHMVCVGCGAVIEFLDDIIEQRQLDIAKKNNFELTDHRLVIYGTCQHCPKVV
jgi:Fur family transcriptional regulator, ferric uptake regulator